MSDDDIPAIHREASEAAKTAAAQMDREAEAAVLLEAGSKTIAKLAREKEMLEAEIKVMSVLLNSKTEEISILRQKLEQAESKASGEEVERATMARNIAVFNLAEINDQKQLLTRVLADALTLIEHLVGELQHHRIRPRAALELAHKQFKAKMERLLRLNRDISVAIEAEKSEARDADKPN